MVYDTEWKMNKVFDWDIDGDSMTTVRWVCTRCGQIYFSNFPDTPRHEIGTIFGCDEYLVRSILDE